MNSKNLMQSVDLTFARYMYLKSKGIKVTKSNYILLFMGNDFFKNKFGVTNNELVKRYKYTASTKNIMKKR